ncbi:hypothetical protein LTSEWAN_1586 [Salmonella enterica subsp. enterica serovar Wandsworth str. A4-580]|uniref:Uncharacterized protein n=1 Tax=Salmonella enterica subsp. enterica serovar Wandsworth str. A4-580 TaxID=913086 RepID=G5S9E1_SALET|nr:hypothetical protein LTSEWAN_1586 [Salmonella enterica subsp. enterica serovar Wandsworth str. A4-580]
MISFSELMVEKKDGGEVIKVQLVKLPGIRLLLQSTNR